jgi:hypothetical protein
MVRFLALNAAEPDALGIRWAIAQRGPRRYLAWRDADGREGIEIKRTRHGHRLTYRVEREPRGVSWYPLRPVIAEVSANCRQNSGIETKDRSGPELPERSPSNQKRPRGRSSVATESISPPE